MAATWKLALKCQCQVARVRDEGGLTTFKAQGPSQQQVYQYLELLETHLGSIGIEFDAEEIREIV
jgi:hypothetical protein